jgi:hypothetical protein
MFLERQIEAPVPFKKVKVKAAAASISRRLTVETPTYRDSQPLTAGTYNEQIDERQSKILSGL